MLWNGSSPEHMEQQPNREKTPHLRPCTCLSTMGFIMGLCGHGCRFFDNINISFNTFRSHVHKESLPLNQETREKSFNELMITHKKNSNDFDTLHEICD